MTPGSGPHGSASRMVGLVQSRSSTQDLGSASEIELRHAIHGAAVGIRLMCVDRLRPSEVHDLVFFLNRIDTLVEELTKRAEAISDDQKLSEHDDG